MATRSSDRVAGDAGAPDTASPVFWIPIEQIRPYERNPRRAENPAYEDIKESIRVDGMLQPLIVTRRPGEGDYLVAAGGNTRLRAIKELFAESGDERFAHVYCVVRPWAGEKAVLAGHLKENDLRGGLTFIDRARAVLALLELVAEEQGGAALTQRQAVTALRDLGYVVSQSLISYIEYAVKRLGPLLPTALKSGIGRRQVERIRSLERVAEVVWTTLSAKGAEAFAPAFDEACRTCDGPNWNLAALRHEVESEIARHVHVGLDTVREKLAAHLDGGDITSDDLIKSSAIAGAASVGIARPAPPSGEPGAPADSNGTGCRDPDDKTIRHDQPQPTEPFGDASEDPNPDMSTREATLRPPSDQSSSMDLKSLRARAWTLAQRIAQRHGLETLIAPLVGKGFGSIPFGAFIANHGLASNSRVSRLNAINSEFFTRVNQ